MPQDPGNENSPGNRERRYGWVTKARRIRTKVKNKRQINRTKKQKISWLNNRKENLDGS